MMPLISVIVPVYNVARFLKKCVQSILSQTFTDFELLLIDDGSTDDSRLICDDYQKKDDRIKVVHKINGGLSSARNAGLDLAKGNYVCFIDSDDFVHVNFLERLYNSIKDNDSDISCCNFAFTNEEGEILSVQNKNCLFSSRTYDKNKISKIAFDKNRISFVITVNKLYKRKLFDNIRFPLGRLHEDEWVVHRIFGEAKSISTIEDVLYYYVQREGSIVHYKNNVRPLKSRIDAYYALLDRYIFSKKNHWNVSKHNSARGCMHIFLRIMTDFSTKDTIDFVNKEIKTINKIDFFSIRQIKLRVIVINEFLKYRRKNK